MRKNAEDVSLKASIRDDGSGPKMLEIVVGGIIVRFSVESVEPSSRNWIADILGMQLRKVYAAGYNAATADIRKAREVYLDSMK